MSDTLTARLRGQYKIGPDGVYGTRDFSDFIPPISLEAADRIEQLESKLKEAAEFIQKLGPTIDYDIAAEIKEMLDE